MEYNTKTRMVIGGFVGLMLIVFSIVMMTILASVGKKSGDRPVNGTPAGDDAIYVNATPDSLATLPPESTEATTKENPAAEAEKKPIYYVTISGNSVVILDEYGEFLQTLNENAAFLPKGDLALLRKGIEVFSKEELVCLMEDFS